MSVSKSFILLRGSLVVLALISFVVLLSAGLTACDRPVESKTGPRPSPPVVVMPVALSDVVVYRDYPARVYGARQVQVRARVEGILENRQYEEGQVVEKDDLLFVIDPEPYEIALRRAEADFDDAHAQFRHAERQWTRYSSLYAQDAISEREHDLAETEYLLARARMERADAARADARRNLRYTTVRAPVAGATDRETVSEGNLVEFGSLLTTITQQDPVHLRFAIPENDAMIQRAARDASDSGKKRRYEASLILPDGSQYSEKGEIDFTASTINPETGSITARAVFPNKDNTLIPGQFLRVRIRLEELKNIFLIPESAVSRGRDGARVFVVDADDVARGRIVRTGPVVDGSQVLLDGLEKGERVVINGHVALRDGIKVLVTNPVYGSAEEAR